MPQRPCCGSVRARRRVPAQPGVRCEERSGCPGRAAGCRLPMLRMPARGYASRRARRRAREPRCGSPCGHNNSIGLLCAVQSCDWIISMPRRVLQLLVGLVLYGAGCALTVEAGLGVDPWTVFAQGISIHTGIGIGWVTNIVGFLVLLLWIPLRQKPGVGTIANILLVGTSMQIVLYLMPAVSGLVAQIAALLGGILLVAVASGLYIGARFGPGPRDGLMTGLHARLGWPIWLCRALVELSVLLA